MQHIQAARELAASGMDAVFAGAARAPITAVVIMFELTGEHTVILPLMSAIVLAAFISQRIAPRDTLYTPGCADDTSWVPPSFVLPGLMVSINPVRDRVDLSSQPRPIPALTRSPPRR